MVELVRGSDEQMVEYVALKKLRIKVQEVSYNCSTAKNYLKNIDNALSYYHIFEDERYWKLLLLSDDDEVFNGSLSHLENAIYKLDDALDVLFKGFFILLGSLLVIMFVFISVLTVQLLAFFFLILVLYIFHALNKLNNLSSPLSNILFNIIKNSEFTYGKRMQL